MTDRLIEQKTAAGIAGRVLIAWHSGQCTPFGGQRERSRGILLLSSIVDAWEMEKLDALDGALECLQSASAPQARVRAALRMLEHLAIQSRADARP